MDYKYSVGMAFKAALERLRQPSRITRSRRMKSTRQQQKLNAAGAALAGNEFVKAETVNVSYDDQTRGAFSYDSKGSGTLASDAAAHSYQGKKALYNRTILTASIPDAAAENYTSLSWTVVSKSSGTDIELGDKTVTVAGNIAGATAQATLLCTAVDTYGRTVVRQVRVVIATAAVTGVSLDKQSVEQFANAGEFTLTATVKPERR